MANRGHQLIHADALAAELEALGLDASIFGAAGIPAPIFANLIPRRAGVWDTLPNTFGFADFSSAFTRASDGLYRDGAGKWQAAGNGVIRPDHDASGNFLGLLFEPESVNKCENYNANPDAALTNLTDTAGGTLSRVADPALIAASNLENICTDGNVLNVSTAGAATDIVVGGAVGNLNDHRVSAFIQTVSGTVQLLLQGDTINAITIPAGTTLARYKTLGVPTNVTFRLIVRVQAASECNFVLNQLEEVATSPIITLGASATRAAESLNFPITGFVNDSQGMFALLWRPQYGKSATGAGTSRNLIGLEAANTSWLFQQHSAPGNTVISFTDKSNFSEVTLDSNNGPIANDLYLLLGRWNDASTFQVGLKKAGTVTWGNAPVYAGSFAKTGFRVPHNIQLPTHQSGLFVWNRDAGTAFLEKAFSQIANA